MTEKDPSHIIHWDWQAQEYTFITPDAEYGSSLQAYMVNYYRYLAQLNEIKNQPEPPSQQAINNKAKNERRMDNMQHFTGFYHGKYYTQGVLQTKKK